MMDAADDGRVWFVHRPFVLSLRIETVNGVIPDAKAGATPDGKNRLYADLPKTAICYH